MTDPLPLPLAQEIRETLEKITPYPWAWESIAEKSNEWAVGQAWREDGTPIEGRIPEGEEIEDVVIERRLIGMNESGHANFADAEFIAKSPALLRRCLEEIERRDAALARIHASFSNVARDANGKCQCPYCTHDAEALAELAANYELDKFAVEQKLKAAEQTLADLRQQVEGAERAKWRLIWDLLEEFGITRANRCPDTILREEWQALRQQVADLEAEKEAEKAEIKICQTENEAISRMAFVERRARKTAESQLTALRSALTALEQEMREFLTGPFPHDGGDCGKTQWCRGACQAAEAKELLAKFDKLALVASEGTKTEQGQGLLGTAVQCSAPCECQCARRDKDLGFALVIRQGKSCAGPEASPGEMKMASDVKRMTASELVAVLHRLMRADVRFNVNVYAYRTNSGDSFSDKWTGDYAWEIYLRDFAPPRVRGSKGLRQLIDIAEGLGFDVLLSSDEEGGGASLKLYPSRIMVSDAEAQDDSRGTA